MAYLAKKKMPAAALLRSRAAAASMRTGTVCRLVHFETGHGLPEALKDVTHIVNLTGSIDTSRSERELAQANVVPTRHLLACASPKLKRFVHISSIAVYGKHPKNPVHEHSPRRGDTPYARTKLSGERLALDAAHRMPITVLQPAIIYGPGFEAGFFPVLRALKSGRLSIIGEGKNRIPFIHADDVVAAIIRALQTDTPSGSVFLLSGESITQEKALASAARAMGAKAPHSHISPRLARLAASLHGLARRLRGKAPTLTPDMMDQLSADRFFDCSHAKNVLGWKPAISFKAGLAQVISDYQRAEKKEKA
jgi:nucleoside-diphosphate-sugar epimerase